MTINRNISQEQMKAVVAAHNPRNYPFPATNEMLSAHELLKHAELGDARGYESIRDMVVNKMRESNTKGSSEIDGDSLADSMKKNGIVEPIDVGWYTDHDGSDKYSVDNGHHRLLTAYNMDRNAKVPAKVTYYGKFLT